VDARFRKSAKESRCICKRTAGRISHPQSVADRPAAANRPRFMGLLALYRGSYFSREDAKPRRRKKFISRGGAEDAEMVHSDAKASFHLIRLFEAAAIATHLLQLTQKSSRLRAFA
jgi:hypothetical protein